MAVPLNVKVAVAPDVKVRVNADAEYLTGKKKILRTQELKRSEWKKGGRTDQGACHLSCYLLANSMCT